MFIKLNDLIKFILMVFEFWGFIIVLFNLFFLVIHIKNKNLNRIIKSLFFLCLGLIAFNLKYFLPVVVVLGV